VEGRGLTKEGKRGEKENFRRKGEIFSQAGPGETPRSQNEKWVGTQTWSAEGTKRWQEGPGKGLKG